MFFGSSGSDFRGRNERVTGGRSVPLRQKQEGARNQAFASRPSVPHHSLNALIAFVSLISLITFGTLRPGRTGRAGWASWTLKGANVRGAELVAVRIDDNNRVAMTM